MPTFAPGEFSVKLALERLSGDYAVLDKQAAWRLYVAIISCRSVRGGFFSVDSDTPPVVFEELHRFVRDMQRIMASWPAGHVSSSKPSHLGHVLALCIEMIVLPFIERWEGMVQQDEPQIAFINDWKALRDFFRGFAREVADCYTFPDATRSVPRELIEFWSKSP